MKRLITLVPLLAMALAACAGTGLFTGEPLGRQLDRVRKQLEEQCRADGTPPFGPNKPRQFETSCLMFALKPWEIGDTPESAFAHSIKLPSPHDKPKNVYKAGMSSEEYFRTLCNDEAGEWVFRTVKGVEGIRFERPSRTFPMGYARVTYYTSEPGEIDYTEPEDYFVKHPIGKYSYVAYRVFSRNASDQGLRYRVVERLGVSGAKTQKLDSVTTKNIEYAVSEVSNPRGDYGVVWRGVKRRPEFHEHAVEGREIVVFEIQTKQVLAFRRTFFQFFQDSNILRQAPRYADAHTCPQKMPSLAPRVFIESVLIPAISE